MPRQSRSHARQFIFSVDRNGLLWATEFRHPFLNRTMEFYSRSGDWDSWVYILLVLGLAPGRPRRILKAILPRLLGALIICFIAKRFACRDRPSVAVEGFSALIADPDPYSFPSSHAATSWAACLSVARATGGLGWLLPFHAALVSYSRIHVGAHYPFDVLVGAGIGTIVASI